MKLAAAEMLERLEGLGLYATRALSIAGLIPLMFLAVMTLADGLLRWLANSPIDGVRDLGALAVALAVSCCIPVGLMERGNITIRVAATVFGSGVGRFLDALAAVVVGLVVGLMAWQFTLLAGKLAKAGEGTWLLKIPVAPFWYGVAVILWCAVLVQVVVAAVDVTRFIREFARRALPGNSA